MAAIEYDYYWLCERIVKHFDLKNGYHQFQVLIVREWIL